MARMHSSTAHTRGRKVRPPKPVQPLMLIAIVGVLAVIVLGGAIVAGLNSSRESAVSSATLPPLQVAQGVTPPNAEPNGRAWGPKDAPIQVVEYLDYQCPACGQYAGTEEAQVVAAFAASGKVRYEVRNFQFKGAESKRAAEASFCAAEQNAFWPMHASIFINQPSGHVADAGTFSVARLNELAGKLGLNTEAFGQCLASRRYEGQVQAEYDEAVRLQIQSTPTFLVNGRPYVGVQTAEDFRRIFSEVAPNVRFDS